MLDIQNNVDSISNILKCENFKNHLSKGGSVCSNSKHKAFNYITDDFQNLEFMNVVSSNVFGHFLGVGHRNFEDIDFLLKSNLESFEYIILSFLLRFEFGLLDSSNICDYIADNVFFKNLYFFLTLLKNISWEQFFKFSQNLNKIFVSESSFTLMALDSLKKILHFKNLVKLFRECSIGEGHFKIAIKQFRLNKNLSSLDLNNEISKHFKTSNFNNLNFFNLFSNITVGYYNAVIDKYSKYFFISGNTYKKDLSLVLKKRRWAKLNANKSSGNLTYAHALALAYIGNPLILPFAPKPINLRYRAYRIFLYAFKLKPFKLWQLTRKSRGHKYGGLLLDHLAQYELTIKNILMLSNFCLDLNDVLLNLKSKNISINGKIILSENFVVRPFDFIHFNDIIFRSKRSKFLLDLASSSIKNIFKNEFSQLFEYNFKIFGFLMLPSYFEYRRCLLSPYYTMYNAGRFTVTKS